MASPRAPSPMLPRPVHGSTGRTFTTDRHCPRCEYNLKGLAPGMNCPECGALIITPAGASARDETLAAAPRHYLAVLAGAVGLMFLSSVVGAICAFQPRPQSFNAVVIFGALAATCWCIGVVLATQPRPHAITRAVTPRMEQRHARWIVRVTQLGWLALPIGLGCAAVVDQQTMNAAAAAAIAFQRSNISILLSTGAWTGAGIGIFGMALLCYMLADLAEWASDSGLADRFRFAGLGLPLATPIALLSLAYYNVLGPIAFLGVIAGVLALIVLAASAVVFLLGNAQLAYLCFWAIRNSEHWDEMLERKHTREQKFSREMIDRLDATPMAAPREAPAVSLDGAAVDIPAPAVYAPVVIAASEHIIPKTEKVQPYELSDEPPVV